MPAAAHCLLLDIGGQSLRAALLDREGRLLALQRRALVEMRPHPGWVEHDAEALLADLRDAIAAVAGRHRDLIGPDLVAGLSCQRASVVCWDRRNGAPLSPVISWQDVRGEALLCATALDPAATSARTGVRPSAFLGASKLAWCRRNLPDVAAAHDAGRLAWGPLGSFLLFRMLRENPYLCPGSLAQRSGLFDPFSHSWDEALCAAFAIAPDSLPGASADLHRFGTLGVLEQGVPLFLCAGDQNLLPAALGLAPDEAVVNLGTGAFLLAGGDGADPRLQRSVLPGNRLPPALVMEGTVNGAAAALAWWARQSASNEISEIPGSDASTPHFLDAVGGIGSPLWRSGDRPRFSAQPVSAAQGRASIADGIVHLLMLNLQAMRAQGLAGGRLYAGGGLAAADGLLQRLADLTGSVVCRPRQTEFSLAGAAVLLGAAPPALTDGDRFAPGPGADRAQKRHAAWREFMAHELDLKLE